jgi:RNA polymerase sigma-70 factor (ECF subfamily)
MDAGVLGGASPPTARDMSRDVPDALPSPADLAMDRYARGEDAAFAELYDLLAPRLLRHLTRQTRSDARAEDIVQKTFLRIHRARGRFLPGAAVVPWAMAIARRLLIDEIRSRSSERLARSLDDDPYLEPADESPSATDLVAAQELSRRIQRELAKLPASQREAFELVKQDELSLAEAAAVLGTTVTAVKLRAHRAYLALRAALSDLADLGADPSDPKGDGGA